ncbi:MAG TPA: DUF4126 domain-containing protein [Pyrinomonadaceae bacterium]|nr:DUF4126 domain-containing protein [Pyrinomonadaceae bacterium]
MNLIGTLAIAMGAGWVSGINLYAAVATLGLLGRFANLQMPGELDVLTSWWIIGIAATMYSVEFFADKIPYLDSTWDAIHTFIRIPAGAVLAATAFGDFDRSVQVVALLLGGGLALSAHGTKASARAAVNLSPEPVSNVVVSIAEDILAVGAILLSIFLPVVLIGLVIFFVVVSIFVIPRMISLLLGTARRLRRAFG